jgi:hypothetical protein
MKTFYMNVLTIFTLYLYILQNDIMIKKSKYVKKKHIHTVHVCKIREVFIFFIWVFNPLIDCIEYISIIVVILYKSSKYFQVLTSRTSCTFFILWFYIFCHFMLNVRGLQGGRRFSQGGTYCDVLLQPRRLSIPLFWPP